MNERIPRIRVRSDNGLLVAREGLILCFFMRRSHAEVAPAVWRTLLAYREALPPQSLNWYIASEGAALPLDEARWENTREELLGPSPRPSLVLQLQQCHDEASAYHFEYHGRRLDAPVFSRDENATCAVSFTLPTEHWMEHGPARAHALALRLAQELPLDFGYMSLALIPPTQEWYAARRTVRELRDRYPGLDVAQLEQTSRVLGTRVRGIYWLTFLGQPLLDRLGGLEALRQRLTGSGIFFHPLDDHRVLLILDEWPELIDTRRREQPPPRLLLLARLLEPFLYEQEVTGWFVPDDTEGLEDMRRWIRRFCP